MNFPHAMQHRMRICGALVLAGLLIEVVSLSWSSPPAFLLFAIIGIPVLSLGILLFLYSLVSVKTRDEKDTAIDRRG